MRVTADLSEDQEVNNVDDTNANALVTEDGGGSDDLVGDFDTTTNENDVRVHPAFGRILFPNGSTSDAVLASFVD